MILKIYIIGLVLSIVWWGILSIMVFEEKIYEKLDESTQFHINELRQSLEEMGSNNLQLTYFFISMFVSFLWPIFIPYLIFKKFSN
jgi:hypothetical protein